jgi:hypothetical protein
MNPQRAAVSSSSPEPGSVRSIGTIDVGTTCSGARTDCCCAGRHATRARLPRRRGARNVHTQVALPACATAGAAAAFHPAIAGAPSRTRQSASRDRGQVGEFHNPGQVPATRESRDMLRRAVQAAIHKRTRHANTPKGTCRAYRTRSGIPAVSTNVANTFAQIKRQLRNRRRRFSVRTNGPLTVGGSRPPAAALNRPGAWSRGRVPFTPRLSIRGRSSPVRVSARKTVLWLRWGRRMPHESAIGRSQ